MLHFLQLSREKGLENKDQKKAQLVCASLFFKNLILSPFGS